jgi:hypothetical protein
MYGLHTKRLSWFSSRDKNLPRLFILFCRYHNIKLMNRTRTFENETVLLQSGRLSIEGGVAQPQITWNYHNVPKSYDRLDDVKVENFKRRSAAGEIIINPFTRYTKSFSTDAGTMTSQKVSPSTPVNKNTFSGHFMLRLCEVKFADPLYLTVTKVKPSTLEDVDFWISDLKKEMAANLEKSRYSFGEDVAEARKTLESVRSLIPMVGNIIARIPKLTQVYVKNGFTLNQAASKVWLKIRYELRPLLISLEQGITAALTELNTAVGKRDRIARFKGLSFTDTEDWSFGDLTNGLFSVRTVRKLDVRVNVGAYFENDDPIRSTLGVLGLGTKDIVPTLWAITRFSFLVDKFINISNLIRGLENTLDPDIKILGAWQNVAFSHTDETNLQSFVRNNYSNSFAAYKTTLVVSNKSRELTGLSLADVLAIDFKMAPMETFVDLYAIFVSPKLRAAKF